jgi:hypothetical protein
MKLRFTHSWTQEIEPDDLDKFDAAENNILPLVRRSPESYADPLNGKSETWKVEPA